MSSRSAAIAVLVLAFLAALSGCARKHTRAGVYSVPSKSSAPSIAPQESIAAAGREAGLASWYGVPYDGRPAANGEIYDMEKLTAAHRTLPFGAWVRVTNIGNQKFVDVRITDRGPFVDGRIIDLSKAAARAIDMIGPGTAAVRLDILSAPADPRPPLYAVQVGAFEDKARADRLRASLASGFHPVRLVERNANPVFWRVLVGEARTLEEAGSLAAQLRPQTGHAFVVSLEGIAFSGGTGVDAASVNQR